MVDKSGTQPDPAATDLDAIIAEKVAAALALREQQHADQVTALRAMIPDHTIPQNGAGPGIAIRRSWSLAEQEAAARGEDHWS